MGHKPWDLPWRRAEKRSEKQAWRDEAGEEVRAYGTDVTDRFDTIAEATLMEDGTWHFTAVVMDRDERGG